MAWNVLIPALLGSSVVSTVVSQIFKYFENRSKAKSGEAEAMRLVLKDRLRFLCIHYVEQGWIYEDELEDIMEMHKCYHDKLNGNGYLDVLMGKVKALPIRGVGV